MDNNLQVRHAAVGQDRVGISLIEFPRACSSLFLAFIVAKRKLARDFLTKNISLASEIRTTNPVDWAATFFTRQRLTRQRLTRRAYAAV